MPVKQSRAFQRIWFSEVTTGAPVNSRVLLGSVAQKSFKLFCYEQPALSCVEIHTLLLSCYMRT
jgi:hypothetical protein